jgi:hypothetical protein
MTQQTESLEEKADRVYMHLAVVRIIISYALLYTLLSASSFFGPILFPDLFWQPVSLALLL